MARLLSASSSDNEFMPCLDLLSAIIQVVAILIWRFRYAVGLIASKEKQSMKTR